MLLLSRFRVSEVATIVKSGIILTGFMPNVIFHKFSSFLPSLNEIIIEIQKKLI